MDDVLKELGPKQNPNLRHRLLPAAKVVGEGALTFPLMLAAEMTANDSAAGQNMRNCDGLAGASVDALRCA